MMAKKTTNDDNLTPAMRQWVKFRKTHPDSTILFQMGDFYELFNEDAIEISKVLDIRLTSRGKDDKAHPLAGFPLKALKNYLPRLVDAGYKVVLVEQEETQSSKTLFERSITRIVTSGTITDVDLLEKKQSNYLMAVSKFEKYGYACVDISTGEFFIGEVDLESQLLDEIVKYNPVEILLEEQINLALESKLNRIISNSRVRSIEEHNFSIETAYDELIRMFNVANLRGFGCEEHKIGIATAGAILNYLKMNLVRTDNIKSIRTTITSNSLTIDSIARKNLELEKNLRDGTENETLLWVLDRTVTAFGARYLRMWLREPLIEVDEINKRLDSVEEINNKALLKTNLRETLEKFIDLERMYTKIIYRRVNANDLLGLKESLERIPIIKNDIKSMESELLKEINKEIFESRQVIDLIEKSISANRIIGNIRSTIKPGYNEELDELCSLLLEGSSWMNEFEEREKKRIEKLASSQNKKALGIKVGYTPAHGHFIEVSNKTPVPDDYNIYRALKNSTRYRTQELEERANKLMNAEEQITVLEKKLFNEIIEIIAESAEEIKKTAKNLAILDILTTFSEIAEFYGYVRPEISDDSLLQIVKGRHPVVERILAESTFVPNDVEIGGKHRLLVVTGANMGGKSVYLRQIALITIMAQIGSFVPAEIAKIGIADRIFTRVGVVDDITRQQSHFLVEMNETANIMHNSTARSLVLLDEIGRGTDSAIGMALAWAIAKYVYQVNQARTLFATHFHELNKLENEFEGIKNVHVAVEERDGELIFLWKVLPGGTTESYGLEVAKLAGIPMKAINEAEKVSEKITKFKVFDKATKELTKKPKTLTQYFGVATKAKKKYIETPEEKKAKKIISKIEELNINNTTPMEALDILNELIEDVRRE